MEGGNAPVAAAVPLYEQDALFDLTGGALRPGGLALTAELLTCSGLQPGDQLLDVGCGPGHSARLLQTTFGLGVCGLDPAASMLEKARQAAPQGAFCQGVATALPWHARCFDGVLSECVLSLTEDAPLALAEMFRVLKPGGKLILTDIYCRDGAQGPVIPTLKSCISQAKGLEEIVAAVNGAGFTIQAFRDRTDLLKQLAGQIIFSYGSLESFWRLFMGEEAAQQTCCVLGHVALGYYALIAHKGENDG